MASHSPRVLLWHNTLYHLLPQQSFTYLHLYLQPHVALRTATITPLHVHPSWRGYGRSNTSSCNSLESHYSTNDAEDNEYQCYPTNDSCRVDAELAGI